MYGSNVRNYLRWYKFRNGEIFRIVFNLHQCLFQMNYHNKEWVAKRQLSSKPDELSIVTFETTNGDGKTSMVIFVPCHWYFCVYSSTSTNQISRNFLLVLFFQWEAAKLLWHCYRLRTKYDGRLCFYRCLSVNTGGGVTPASGSMSFLLSGGYPSFRSHVLCRGYPSLWSHVLSRGTAASGHIPQKRGTPSQDLGTPPPGPQLGCPFRNWLG